MSSSNLSVDGVRFFDGGDNREARGRLLMRPDETFSHIPRQSPGLPLATLLSAVQTNKASLRGPPEPCQAQPGQTAHLWRSENIDSPFLTPVTRGFFNNKTKSFHTVWHKLLSLMMSRRQQPVTGNLCVPEQHAFKSSQSLIICFCITQNVDQLLRTSCQQVACQSSRNTLVSQAVSSETKTWIQMAN